MNNSSNDDLVTKNYIYIFVSINKSYISILLYEDHWPFGLTVSVCVCARARKEMERGAVTGRPAGDRHCLDFSRGVHGTG